jgi:hypothetical protein
MPSRIAIWLLVLATAALCSESAQKIDLQALLSYPAAMEKLVVEYRPDMQTALFVHGTGRVVKQAHSVRAPNVLVPTCTGNVDQEEVRKLVREMIVHHFFDLPIRSFTFLFASDDLVEAMKELKQHSIVIDDGLTGLSVTLPKGFTTAKKSSFHWISASWRRFCSGSKNPHWETSLVRSVLAFNFHLLPRLECCLPAPNQITYPGIHHDPNAPRINGGWTTL